METEAVERTRPLAPRYWPSLVVELSYGPVVMIGPCHRSRPSTCSAGPVACQLALPLQGSL
jgi:hypothetical protein